jgi:Cu/Ag efflux pump CusA
VNCESLKEAGKHPGGDPEMDSTGLGEQVSFSERRFDKFTTDLRTIQESLSLGIPGVASQHLGGLLKEEISVQPNKLKSTNTTSLYMMPSIKLRTMVVLHKKPNAFIRGLGMITSMKDIQKIVVKMSTHTYFNT